MKMVAQGYPLFAVTVNADGEDPRLGWVVGWSVQSGHEAWPVVAMPGGMAYVKRPSFLRYIGPDREAAQKAVNGAVSATLSPERCGELTPHRSHNHLPLGGRLIRCPGVPDDERRGPRVESAPRGESRSDQPGETPLSRG